MGRSRSRSCSSVSRSRSSKNGGRGGGGGDAETMWYKYMSPQGIPYYHAPSTQSTVWEMPSGPKDRIVDQAPPPPGMTASGQGGQLAVQSDVVWQRCCDQFGRMYYHNVQSKETVWEKPANGRIEDHPDMPSAQNQMAQQQMIAQQQQQAAYHAHMGAMYGGMPPGMPPGMPMHGMPPGMPCGMPGAMVPYGMPGMMPGMMPPMGHMPGMFGVPPHGGADDIDGFVAKNRLDANACAKLKALPTDLRRAVMERGDLSDARNPNAVLMGRIRDAEQAHRDSTTRRAGEAGGGGGGSAPGGPPGSLEAFIAENRIDAIAGERLRTLPVDVQQKVMDRGNLTDARNPNAVLMGRIRDAQKESGK